MDTPTISPEQVQDNNPTSAGGEDKIDTVTTKQPNVVPTTDTTATTGNASSEPFPQVDGAGDPITSANPNDPVIELRVQRANASSEELNDEALELMEILRDCIFHTSELTGFLAGHPETIRPVQNEVSVLDAMSSYLTTILGPSTCSRMPPTPEQALRRAEIHSRHYRAINQMRRLPIREEEDLVVYGREPKGLSREVDLAEEFGSRNFEPVIMTGPLGRPWGFTGSSQEEKAQFLKLLPDVESNIVDPDESDMSHAMRFLQLHGWGRQESVPQEVDGSGQGDSSSS